MAHYTAEGGKETADEVDRIGDDGLRAVKVTATHLDRGAKTVSVKTADGAKETFRVTGVPPKKLVRECQTYRRRCQGNRLFHGLSGTQSGPFLRASHLGVGAQRGNGASLRPTQRSVKLRLVSDCEIGLKLRVPRSTVPSSSAARGRSFHLDSSPTAMSSGSSIVICMVAGPPCQLSQEQLSMATRAGASSTGSCAKARYAQVPGCSAPAGTGPSARACDRTPFRRERVSRAADFRGAGSVFPTDGIVTRSNSS